MGNLQDIDRNSREWHQVLDNDAPNFPQNFSPLGTPGPINCIPPTSMPHEYVIMLLGDELIDLIFMEMQNSYQNQAMKILIYVEKNGSTQYQGRVPCLLGNFY